MWLDLLKYSLEESFGDELKDCIGRLGMSIKEFSEESRTSKEYVV